MTSKLIAIIGPTASGKSDLAMAVAQRLGADLLSVDSMQVYRRMNIGTSKPTAAERAAVRHHGIDLVEPTESFTVADFVALADRTIAGAGDRPLVLCGGTPLYFKSLFDGLFEGPPRDLAFRDSLRAEPADVLHARLASADPAAAERIHANDTKRVLRALEVFHATGKPISDFQTAWASGIRRHEALWIGLNWDKEAINRRINARTKLMLNAGWLEEVRMLPRPLSRTAGEATGYRVLLDHLEGRVSLDDATEQIKIGTRQLARRQMKWFRRFEGVHWLAGPTPTAELVTEVIRRWQDPSCPVPASTQPRPARDD